MNDKVTSVRQNVHLGTRIAREASTLRFLASPRLRFWSFLVQFLPAYTLPLIRAQFYRWAGCCIEAHVAILDRMILIGQGDTAARLTIGEGSIIAPGVKLGLDECITIGRNVSISPWVTLYTATHALGFGSRRMGLTITPKPITIGDGAWVGMHSIILPGVTLGAGCVVSAGAVVTTDVPPNTLVAGNPATVQQSLPFGNR